MDANEMKLEFLVLYDEIASNSAPGFTDEEIGIFLSKAEEVEFLRGFYPYNSFEENEKKLKDFSELKENATPSQSTIQTGVQPNGVFFDLPTDFQYSLKEEATIASSDTCINGDRIEIVPVTEDEYNRNIKSPFKKPSDTRAWRLDFSRVVDSTNPKRHEIITNGNYTISTYHLRYFRRLTGITPFLIGGDGTTTVLVNSILDEILHHRIVEKAVRIATGVNEEDKYQIKLNEEKINE